MNLRKRGPGHIDLAVCVVAIAAILSGVVAIGAGIWGAP